MKMVNPIGVVSYALWGKEDTYGTAPANINKPFMETQSATFRPRDELFKKRSLAGGQDVQGSYLGMHEVSVSIESLLTTEGDLWELILGGTPTDDGTGTMVVEPANTLPSFTTQLGYKGYDGDLTAFNILGCKINSAEISVSKGDVPAKLRLDIVGQKEAKVSPQANPTQPSGVLLTQLDASIDAGGTVAGVQELTLTINRNLDKKTSVGNRFAQSLYEKARDYAFTMRLYFEDTTQYEKFWGDTSGPTDSATKSPISALSVLLQRDTDHFTKIYLANVYWEEIESPINLEDLVVTTVSGYAQRLEKVEYKNG